MLKRAYKELLDSDQSTLNEMLDRYTAQQAANDDLMNEDNY